MSRLLIIPAAMIMSIVVLTSIAHAKVDPYVEDQTAEWGDVSEPSNVVPDALVSTGLYGQLSTEDDVDAFVYDFAEPAQNWPLSIIIPVCGDHFADFYPTAALIGPGLDVPDDAETLPFEVPEDMGVLVFNELSKSKERVENSQWDPPVYAFTEFKTDIEAGEYVVAVWDTEGQTGAYTLVTGALHPEFKNRDANEINAVFDNIFYTGDWMGQECGSVAKQ